MRRAAQLDAKDLEHAIAIERADDNDRSAKKARQFTWIYFEVINRAWKLGLANGVLGFAPLLLGKTATGPTLLDMLYRLPLALIFFLNCLTAYQWMKSHLDWRYIITKSKEPGHRRNNYAHIYFDILIILCESITIYMIALALIDAAWYYRFLFAFFAIDLLWCIVNWLVLGLRESPELIAWNFVCLLLIGGLMYYYFARAGTHPPATCNFLVLALVILKTIRECYLIP